jgi:hypothetical protein
MGPLIGYLIAGALLSVGIWLRLDDWREAERRRALFPGNQDLDIGHSIYGSATALTCGADGCGSDGGCVGS